MAFQILIPTIPVFVSRIFYNNAIVGAVVGVYTFSAVLLRPISGRILEHPNSNLISIVGMLLFGLLSVSYGMASSLLIFFLIRIGHGAFWGISTTSTSAVAADIIPPGRQIEGMGYFTLSQNIAMALGPGLGIYLISRFSFTALFFSSMSFCIFAALSMATVNSPVKPRVTNPKSGSLLETKILTPSWILFCTTMIQGAIVPFLPLYTAERNLDGYLGLYFAFFAAILIITRPFVGRLAAKNGIYPVALGGLTATLIALQILCHLNSLTALLASAAFWGLGFGSVHPLMMAAAINIAPHNKAVTSATIWTFFDLGIGVGAILAGYVANFGGYQSIYLAFMVFPLAALVLLTLKRGLFRPKPAEANGV